MTELIPTRLL